MIAQPDSVRYIGRFAPSPTGPLHLGSLYTALASFLDARSHGGRWLLRIDDLDTPRNVAGAAERIIDTLFGFGLQWDDDIDFQSQHLDEYAAAIERLRERGLIYRCICSRAKLADSPDRYPGYCRNRNPDPSQAHALRLACPNQDIRFIDRLQGPMRQNLAEQVGDFVVLRKDRIFAYQLAVIVDDCRQGVNHVVRGYDLLDSTPRQCYLYQLFGQAPPTYAHIPVIVDGNGQKLSKQSRAAAVSTHSGARTLYRLLCLLNQAPPPSLRNASIADLLDWGIRHWQPAQLSGVARISQPVAHDY